MDYRHHFPGFDCCTCSSDLFFPLKVEETYTFMNICWAEISRDLEISSKCSVKAIKNTSLSKIRMVSKGFRPMGSNAQLFHPSLFPRHSLLPRCPSKVWERVCASHFQWRHVGSMFDGTEDAWGLGWYYSSLFQRWSDEKDYHVGWLACVQPPPFPQEKIGEGAPSPMFFWGKGAAVHRPSDGWLLRVRLKNSLMMLEQIDQNRIPFFR